MNLTGMAMPNAGAPARDFETACRIGVECWVLEPRTASRWRCPAYSSQSLMQQQSKENKGKQT